MYYYASQLLTISMKTTTLKFLSEKKIRKLPISLYNPLFNPIICINLYIHTTTTTRSSREHMTLWHSRRVGWMLAARRVPLPFSHFRIDKVPFCSSLLRLLYGRSLAAQRASQRCCFYSCFCCCYCRYGYNGYFCSFTLLSVSPTCCYMPIHCELGGLAIDIWSHIRINLTFWLDFSLAYFSEFSGKFKTYNFDLK